MMSFPRASNSGGTRGECQWVAEPNVRLEPVSVTFAASDWADSVSFLGLTHDSWSDKSQFKHLYIKDKHQMVDAWIHQVP